MINGSLSNPVSMVVQPGWNSSNGCIVRRENGSHYAEDWRRVMSNNPRQVIVGSWNDFMEDTAVQPCDTSRLPEDQEDGPWASPGMYWDQTVAGIKAWRAMP